MSTLDTIHQSIKTLQNCTTDVKSSISANKPQLNDLKTDAMIMLSFVSSVKNLVIILDSNLSMSQYTSNTCKAACITNQACHFHTITNTFSSLRQPKPLFALLSSLGQTTVTLYFQVALRTYQTNLKKFRMQQQGLCVEIQNLITSILFFKLFTGGCTSGGVHVPSIYTHAR